MPNVPTPVGDYIAVQQDGQRRSIRWILLGIFGGTFIASTSAHLTLLFLVGFGEITLPQELLIASGAASVANVFPGLIYILGYAFGKIPEPE